jgi:hypothetical protein
MTGLPLTVSAAFLLAAIAVLGLTGINLEDI